MSLDRREIAKRYMQRELDDLAPRDRQIVDQFISRTRLRPGEAPSGTITTGQRIADVVTAGIGSWRFIAIQTAMFLGWALINVMIGTRAWDPYPFIFLNLVLSFQSAYAGPIIMMSQNRQTDQDRAEAHRNYETNTKAELEILELHDKLDELRDQKWQALVEMQQRQIELLEQVVSDLSARRGDRAPGEGTASQG